MSLYWIDTGSTDKIKRLITFYVSLKSDMALTAGQPNKIKADNYETSNCIVCWFHFYFLNRQSIVSSFLGHAL